MSDTNQAAALPPPDMAFQHLFDGVHQEVFFQKLAAFGIQPKTAEEASGYLTLAGKLRTTANDPTIKQAAAANSKVAEMNQALDGVLGDLGIDSGVKQASEQEAHEARAQIANYLAQDPGIYNSVLSVKTAEAQAIQQLLQEQSAEQ